MARIPVSIGAGSLWLALVAACFLQAQTLPNGGGFPPPPAPAQQLGTANAGAAGQPLRAASFSPNGSTGLFEPAETAARLGDQFILTGELLGDVNIMVDPLLSRAKPEDRGKIRAQMETQRPQLLEQQLRDAIDRKLMYIAFLREIPPEKMTEAMGSIEEQIGESFETSLLETLAKLHEVPEEEYGEIAQQDARIFRLALLMKERNIAGIPQLEGVLQSIGSSIRKQQQAFGEHVLGRQAMGQSVDRQPEVTLSEMREYYEKNRNDFFVPARAKWQQLTVRFSQCESKEKAGQLIAELGNEILYGGAPFWAVARKGHGSKAADGGLHDWTDQGDLEVSRQINEQVFSIKLNALSGIIRDSEGLHIVRVLAREDAHVVPFTEAQIDIKRQIQNEKRRQSITKYVIELRERTPVIFKRDFLKEATTLK